MHHPRERARRPQPVCLHAMVFLSGCSPGGTPTGARAWTPAPSRLSRPCENRPDNCICNSSRAQLSRSIDSNGTTQNTPPQGRKGAAQGGVFRCATLRTQQRHNGLPLRLLATQQRQSSHLQSLHWQASVIQNGISHLLSHIPHEGILHGS